MANTNLTSSSSPRRKNKAFGDILILAGDFFMKKGIVFETMRRLAERLENESIPYAVIGGMALAAYGYVRMTLDVDILLTPVSYTHLTLPTTPYV